MLDHLKTPAEYDEAALISEERGLLRAYIVLTSGQAGALWVRWVDFG